MSNFGNFVDYENMAIENRKRIVPTYYSKNRRFNGREITKPEKEEILEYSLHFPNVLENVISDTIGCLPRWRHAAADWSNIERSIGLNSRITGVLNQMGFRLHTPKNLPSTITSNDAARKEASDRELILETVATVRRRVPDGLDKVVLCTGDHFAAKLAYHLREEFSVKIFIAGFESSTSMAIRRMQTIGDPNIQVHFIDKHPMYVRYRDAILDKFGIERIVGTVEDSMLHSVISNRYTTKMEFLTVGEFKKWIAGWFSYMDQAYNQGVQRDVGEWIKFFKKRDIITIAERQTGRWGPQICVELNMNCREVSDAIAEIELDGITAYRYLYNTAPPNSQLQLSTTNLSLGLSA